MIRLFCLPLIACLAIAVAMTQPVVADEADDHAALRALVGAYEQAVEKSDLDLITAHLSPDFSGVMVTAEQVDSAQSLREYWQSIQALIGKGGTYRTKVQVAGPATISGDYAFAHGVTDDIVQTSTGQTYKFAGRWTAVCRKENGDWKILRLHGSMDPIKNEFVATSVMAASRASGLIGGAVGAALAVLLSWAWRRGRRSRMFA